MSDDYRREPTPKEIGERIRAARTALKLTQVQLASAAGMNQSTLSFLERGDTQEVSARVLLYLAAALQTSAVALYWGHDAPGEFVALPSQLATIWARLDNPSRSLVVAYAEGVLAASTKRRPK